eukprot:scaffold300917_cov18-Prasinocladus_malaysianus.AAC.2
MVEPRSRPGEGTSSFDSEEAYVEVACSVLVAQQQFWRVMSIRNSYTAITVTNFDLLVDLMEDGVTGLIVLRFILSLSRDDN